MLGTPARLLGRPWCGELATPRSTQKRLVEEYTAQFNVTGQPAISLPLHWSADGLPMGVQCVAATHREDLLVRLGSQLEAAAPWSHRMPPLV